MLSRVVVRRWTGRRPLEPALHPPRTRVVVRAPAKINLFLCVGRLRPDGYHDLTTVYSAVSLTDELVATAADELSVHTTGEGADAVADGPANLAWRAADLLARQTGRPPAVRLQIRKAIPVAAGCAGGSADAAAALVACDALWGTGLSRKRLAALAAQLGSDVPFALRGGTALGTGRGERLVPVLTRGPQHWVLALADGGLSTPAVYAELDRLRESGPPSLATDPSGVLAALAGGDPQTLGGALHNDLEPAALSLAPALRPVLGTGRALGAVGAVVSGSGPTVALLARDPEVADRLAAELAGRGVCRRVVRADGPVPGAHVVAAD